MASKSKHYGDVAIWIEKVINSCETYSQEETARRLVCLFERQYQDIDSELNWALSARLRNAIDNKFYNIWKNQVRLSTKLQENLSKTE